MGALLGDEHLKAGPGDLVYKPRGQWHTFWNAGDEPCRISEIISPVGFERFFAELVEVGGVALAGPEQLGALCERYALEMDPASLPDLIERSACACPPNHSRRRPLPRILELRSIRGETIGAPVALAGDGRLDNYPGAGRRHASRAPTTPRTCGAIPLERSLATPASAREPEKSPADAGRS